MKRRMVGGRRPLLSEILGQTDRVRAKSQICDLFSFVALKPYDLAKKVQLTLIGSPLIAFFAFSHRIRLLCWPITS